MRSLWLWPLLVPLLLAAVTEVTLADLFVTREVEYASTPLTATRLTNSDVQCGLFCLYQTDCLKWIRDPTTGECRLLPLHSADNPLTSEPATVRQRPHPAGYIPMPGGGVAYGPHGREPLVQGGHLLIELCHQDDPQAEPAFITSDDQFNFLLTLKFEYAHQWTAINDMEEEGVFKDLSNTTTVDITNWISPTPNHGFGNMYKETTDGVIFSQYSGLQNRHHINHMYSYLCEYWM